MGATLGKNLLDKFIGSDDALGQKMSISDIFKMRDIFFNPLEIYQCFVSFIHSV
jgi:hypothetical protein